MLWQWEQSALARLLFVRSLVRWIVCSVCSSVGSFVRPLVRSFDGSFVRASKELYKKTSSGVSAA